MPTGRDWATTDYYARLGVEADATDDEIASAFRALAKQLHPDRSGHGSPASDRFKEATEAYDVLSDPGLRRAYDAVSRARSRPPSAGGATAPNGTAWNLPTGAPPAVRRVDPALRMRRARQFIGGGIAAIVAGCLAAILVLSIQADSRAERAQRRSADALIIERGPPVLVRFDANATTYVAALSEPEGDGVVRVGERVAVRYDPDDPTDIVRDASTLARDITLWIVVAKLTIGGTILLVFGVRRRRDLLRAPR